MGLLGQNPQWTYDPGSGTVTLSMNYPLEADPDGPEEGRIKRRWEAVSLDYSSREVLTVAPTNPVDQIRATQRFIDNPTAFKKMLMHGADGHTLTYSPDGGTTTYPSLLITVDDWTPLSGESSDRLAMGERQVVMTLRRVDGGNYDGLL